MHVGGNIAQARFVDACAKFNRTEILSYSERIEGYRYLNDLLLHPSAEEQPIFVIHWGPDVQMLIKQLEGQDVVYTAHSAGWRITIPRHVPIICVSRNTLGYWGRYAPNSLIRYVPNVVSLNEPCGDYKSIRDIDVLVQRRKSSKYLLHELLPMLKNRCNTVLLEDWVDDLHGYFRRSKVYLYDSVEHWAAKGVTEGFGLPPLEAIACGCCVFSSINDALADFLDPGVNCHKICTYTIEYDVQQILRALSRPMIPPVDCKLLSPYSITKVTARLLNAFTEIEEFFAFARNPKTKIAQP